MKKNIFYFFLFFSFSLFCEEPEKVQIQLPKITTYVESVVEQKVVITEDDIKKSHCESITSLLQNNGVQLLAYGAYGLEQKPSIRGYTDETVRIVIDGVCVNNAQYGTFDFSSINVADISKIEILKGGFTESVLDEGAVGGVIYITTKKQSLGHNFNFDFFTKSFFNFDFPFDTFSTSINYSGQIAENSFLRASSKIGFANNKYWYKNYKEDYSIRQNSEVFDLHSNLNFSHYFGNGNSFSISDLVYYGNKNLPNTETSYNHGKQKDINNILTLNLIFPEIKNLLKLQTNISWLSNNRDFSDFQSKSNHYVNTFKFNLLGEFYSLKKYNQSVGVSLEYTDLDSTDDGKHFQFKGTVKETSTINFCDLFSLVIPLGFTFCNSDFAFVPKIGGKLSFSKFELLLNAYRMIQFPNMDDLYWNGGGFAGNKNLLKEDGFGAEITINVFDFYIPFSFCIFSNYYKNKIQWSGNTVKNVASAFYLGANLSFEKNFFNNLLTISFNGEYLYTRLLDSSSELTYGKKIMWTPDFVASLKLQGNFEFCSLSIDANYVGIRYKTNLNLGYLPPYVLLNLTGEVLNLKYFTPYFKAENLLNWQYHSVDGYPMPGISLTIGCKVDCSF